MSGNMSKVEGSQEHGADVAKTSLGNNSHIQYGKILREYGLYFFMIIWLGFLALFAPQFFSFDNVIHILNSSTPIIIMAVGMTFVITGKGIDISIASLSALSLMITIIAVEWYGVHPLLGIGLGILVGVAGGAFNGAIVVKLGVPSILVTISTWILYRGLIRVVTGGDNITNIHTVITTIGGYRIFGEIWMSIPVAFILGAIGYYLLNYSTIGKYISALGGNQQATKLAGIGVKKYKFASFILLGLFASIAGLIYIGTTGVETGRFYANALHWYEIYTIGAVIIGGTALFGGKGKIWGSVFGAIFVQLIFNGMGMLLPKMYYLRYVGVAILIVLAVGMYQIAETQD